MTRAQYLRREDRKRLASSLAVALAAYAIIAGGILVSGLFRLADLSAMPNTVWVDIGSTADLQGGVAKGGDVPAPRGPVTPAPQIPTPEAKTSKVPLSQPTAIPVAAEKAPAAAAKATTGSGKTAGNSPPSPTPAPAAALPSAGTSGTTGEPWIPGPRPEGSHVISTTSGVGTGGAGTSGAGEASSAGAFTTKVVGNEKGNSLETVLGVGAGKSGRSLYVPIYLYMPLPKTVTDNVALRVAPVHRDLFLRTYRRINEEWVLSRNVPVEQRDEIWLALEEGGYDVAHADYKAGGTLGPVMLSFVVTPPTPGSAPSLQAVTITGSSGDPAVDEAVLYGFKRASFFNATDGTISGTFVYGFNH